MVCSPVTVPEFMSAKIQVALFREVHDLATMGFVVVDRDGIVCVWNRWMEDHSGIAANAALGQALLTIFPALKGGRVDSAVCFALQHELPSVLSHSLNKTPFPLFDRHVAVKKTSESPRIKQAIHVAPLSMPGQPPHCLIQIADVTTAVNRERLLRESEQAVHLAAVAFNSHDGIIITDTAARIIRVNQAFSLITGYSEAEVIGKNPRILGSGRHDAGFYKTMWQEILDTGSWSGEIWDRHKNGSIYPKHSTITAVKNGKGETVQYVAIFSDISERKRAEDEIRNLAFYDPLTKLPNRRLLLDRLAAALVMSARKRSRGAVLFLDMDQFKLLNDSLGHDFGDLLLIEVAERVKLGVREVDTVARFGGDEFLVLLEDIDEDEAEASKKVANVAEKIRTVLAAPYMLKNSEHHSSPSIGVCLFLGSEIPVEELLRRADIAMYQAKSAGRNKVRFYDPLMQQLVETRSALEDDLRHAISRQQFKLHYQIQVDADERPIGAEALLRWVHPVRGQVSPAEFIPLAEESSLILTIGQWVLETACRQLAAWTQGEGTRSLTLAVNVSARQFRVPEFVEQVVALVRSHQIDPSRLKLELTESVVLGDIDQVVAKMAALRELGIHLSLDDFGTGYSSLSYLKQLPLDQIKIDQSFVRDLTINSTDAVMVKVIIHMAQNFSLNVIAEGVETAAQLAFLKQHGCMAYQGYLFSKPRPIDEFEASLMRLAEHH